MKQYNENWDGISRKNANINEASSGLTHVEYIFDGRVVEDRHYMTADRIHLKFVKLWLQSGVLPNQNENSRIYSGAPRTVKINGKEKTSA